MIIKLNDRESIRIESSTEQAFLRIDDLGTIRLSHTLNDEKPLIMDYLTTEQLDELLKKSKETGKIKVGYILKKRRWVLE